MRARYSSLRRGAKKKGEHEPCSQGGQQVRPHSVGSGNPRRSMLILWGSSAALTITLQSSVSACISVADLPASSELQRGCHLYDVKHLVDGCHGSKPVSEELVRHPVTDVLWHPHPAAAAAAGRPGPWTSPPANPSCPFFREKEDVSVTILLCLCCSHSAACLSNEFLDLGHCLD